MKVIEIFDSIDGEGIFAGCLATFIRLAGCNLRCLYCDTLYAMDIANAKEMSVNEILNECKKIGNQHITLTGGEPLIHKDVDKLINVLCNNGFFVNIETNGTIDFEKYRKNNVVITMDYKTISSGENSRMSASRIELLRSCDVLKVVCEESDFEDIKAMLRSCNIRSHVFLSPVFGKINPQELVTFAKSIRNNKNFMGDLRVQLQLHKIIWSSNERGV